MNTLNITKGFLIKEYIINKKSMNQIADEIGCSSFSIFKYLKINNIKTRVNKLINRKGKNNGNYGHKWTKEQKIKGGILTKKAMDNTIVKNKMRGKRYSITGINNSMYGIPRSQKVKNKISKTKRKKGDSKGKNNWNYGKTGKLSPAYIEGLIRKYPCKFNKILKESIRERDNHQCQICGKLENGRKLDVHHIDYDKNNLNPKNLITLCRSCHMQSNGNREIYIEYFGILKDCIK